MNMLQNNQLPGYFLKSLILDKEQSELVNKPDLVTYMEESELKFIKGSMSFDKWDDYVATCKKLGIDDLQKVYQQVYDNVYAGK